MPCLPQTASAPPAAKPASPFGASAPGASPFAAAPGAAASPFQAQGARAAAPQRAPLPPPEKGFQWPKPTLAQIIITISFITITALMLATFFVVLKSGAIHFNDN
jgi:hypothetical protein